MVGEWGEKKKKPGGGWGAPVCSWHPTAGGGGGHGGHRVAGLTRWGAQGRSNAFEGGVGVKRSEFQSGDGGGGLWTIGGAAGRPLRGQNKPPSGPLFQSREGGQNAKGSGRPFDPLSFPLLSPGGGVLLRERISRGGGGLATALGVEGGRGRRLRGGEGGGRGGANGFQGATRTIGNSTGGGGPVGGGGGGERGAPSGWGRGGGGGTPPWGNRRRERPG